MHYNEHFVESWIVVVLLSYHSIRTDSLVRLSKTLLLLKLPSSPNGLKNRHLRVRPTQLSPPYSEVCLLHFYAYRGTNQAGTVHQGHPFART